MEKPENLKIRIKPIRQRPEKAKLPARPGPNYPANLLVVFSSEDVTGELRAYASSDLTYELGGVLVGRIGKSSRRMFVEITHFIPATRGVSHRASFEFTNEAQQEIHRIMDTEHRDRTIVGWFHTHPGYGIFLSGSDQFIDQHYFPEKYHIAMVLDPTKPGVEIGAFVWDKDQHRVRVPFVTF
jgi:proteasome lid subunit RPN8/RPN11